MIDVLSTVLHERRTCKYSFTVLEWCLAQLQEFDWTTEDQPAELSSLSPFTFILLFSKVTTGDKSKETSSATSTHIVHGML